MTAAISPRRSSALPLWCPISYAPNMASPPRSSPYSAAAPEFPAVVKRTSIEWKRRWATRRTAENIGLETVSTLRHLEEAVAAQHHVAVDDRGTPPAAFAAAAEERRAIVLRHTNVTNERSAG